MLACPVGCDTDERFATEICSMRFRRPSTECSYAQCPRSTSRARLRPPNIFLCMVPLILFITECCSLSSFRCDACLNGLCASCSESHVPFFGYQLRIILSHRTSQLLPLCAARKEPAWDNSPQRACVSACIVTLFGRCACTHAHSPGSRCTCAYACPCC